MIRPGPSWAMIHPPIMQHAPSLRPILHIPQEAIGAITRDEVVSSLETVVALVLEVVEDEVDEVSVDPTSGDGEALLRLRLLALCEVGPGLLCCVVLRMIRGSPQDDAALALEQPGNCGGLKGILRRGLPSF